MEIIHFKKFCVPVSTGTSKVDKLLKMPSDSISEGVIFQNFLGGMPPDPPSACMLRMSVSFAHYECKYLTSPTSTMMTGLVVPQCVINSVCAGACLILKNTKVSQHKEMIFKLCSHVLLINVYLKYCYQFV